MLHRQKIFALFLSIAIIVLIIELVRRRKLREEYSWLWILTGSIMIILVVWYDALKALSNLIGAVLPTSTLFLFGLIFFMLLSLHFSVKISDLTDQVKELVQQMALLTGNRGGETGRRRRQVR
jgi:hypothetical protein